jgi:hypothetical protein
VVVVLMRNETLLTLRACFVEHGAHVALERDVPAESNTCSHAFAVGGTSDCTMVLGASTMVSWYAHETTGGGDLT